MGAILTLLSRGTNRKWMRTEWCNHACKWGLCNREEDRKCKQGSLAREFHKSNAHGDYKTFRESHNLVVSQFLI